MNLPLIANIVIGLGLVYLILSLLTSEIQELIAILLQWRADHLRKSIDLLLAGQDQSDPRCQKFTDELYDNPLIRSLNQEGSSLSEQFFRRIIQGLTALYQGLTRTRSVFGSQRSAPSYIPAKTFSAALLQQIQLDALSQKVGELSLRQFGNDRLEMLHRILKDLRNSLGDDSFLSSEFYSLQQTLKAIVEELVQGQLTLGQSIEQISGQFTQFIDNTEAVLAHEHPCKDIVRQRLPYLKQTLLRPPTEPTLPQVLQLLFADEEAANGAGWMGETLSTLRQENPELLNSASSLPQALKQSLLSLAETAHLRAQSLEAGLHHLEAEIAHWFNRSMERTAGVYRRNARGIGILIGFLLAMLLNADPLFMVDRLSSPAGVQPVVDRVTAPPAPASPVLPNPTGSPSPSLGPAPAVPVTPAPAPPVLKDAASRSLPIGWDRSTLAAQESDRRWGWPWLRRLLGWLISAILLGMGAAFWFNLLRRVIPVRGTGRKPGE